MRELLNRSNDRWALLRRADAENQHLAVFVHGFFGNYLATWGRFPDLLNKYADGDQIFSQWDYLFIGYETQSIRSYLDIADRIFGECARANIGDRPYGHPYTRVSLFGHSLGTLGIRQALCAWSKQPKGFLQSLHSVTLFAMPISGSQWAPLAPFVQIASALKTNNPQLRMLRTWVESAHATRPWPTIKIVLGDGDQVVGSSNRELAQWPGDELPKTTPLGHLNMVKPTSWNDCAFIDYVANGLSL
jgi:pimeloyl-ACP methyl ester carboxylesterase